MRALRTARTARIARTAVWAGLIVFAGADALAQVPGSASFRTKDQEQNELIGKLRRDIAKVAHSVEVTKELVSRSRGAPFLPDIHLRLAELYVEQARYEFYLASEERGDDGKGSSVAPTAKLLKEKAVETYQRILADFPDFQDNDKVLFYLAHEFRELGRYEEMIQQYEKLVGKYPKSPLVMDGYLVLGDYRFDRQDLVGAKRYYQKILDSGVSDVQDMAHFKMGWVYLNETDFREALRHFEAAARAGAASRANRDKRGRVSVQREALIDLAYAYTEVKKPNGALKYFRGLSSSRTMYLLALEKLAKRYFVKQEFDAAAMVYREIIRLSYDSEKNLDFGSQIYEATKRSGSYGRVHSDVAAILDSVDDYRFDWRVSDAQRTAAAADFELITRDLATRSQAALKKSKTPDRLGPRVGLAYTRYLESYPESGSRLDILENLGDTLYESKLYLRAGDRYEEAARLAEDEKRREEVLYNACAAFHEALGNASKMPRFDRVWAQQGLIRNGIAYVETYPDSGKVPEIKLNIGRSYFEAGNFEKAIGIFYEFLASYPTHPGAQTVAELILDAHAETQDYAGLAEAARKLSAMNNLGDATFRARLLDTAKRAEERQIGEVILTSSVDRGSGRDAGQQLREYWEQNKSSPVAEKTLYTAFVQYKEARNYEKVFETGNQFIGAYPSSQYLGDVFGTLAAFTSQVGRFEEAAVYLQEYYQRFPSDASAQRNLAQAAAIRRLIGDYRGAIKAYQELIGRVQDRAQRAQYAGEMLEAYEALEDWDGIQAAARDVLRTDPENVKANLMLGLAAQKSGDLTAAVAAFQAAVDGAGRAPGEDVIDDAARAAFGVGDAIFRQFDRIGADGDIQSAAAARAELLAEMESALVDAVGYNRGEWAVAALHRAGLAYENFAKFLENAPPPVGLSADELGQYRQLVGDQAGQIREKGVQFFDTCVKKARELGVFTRETLACANRSPAERIPDVALRVSAPPKQRQDELVAKLTKNPRDADAIEALANYFLASGEPAKARLMASRGAEQETRDPRFPNLMGMAELVLGNPQDAYFGFTKAVDLGHPYAAANLMALMVSFGDVEGAKQVAKRADLDDLPVGAPDLHPDAQAAVTRVTQ